MNGGRIDWIDYAKGLGVVFIVLISSAIGFGQSEPTAGWMIGIAAWLTPFTAPAFFLLSGLLVRRTMYASTATYFDRKVLRVAYFFALWLALETLVLKALPLGGNIPAIANAYVDGLLSPSSPLWYIQLLVLFHLATRLLRQLPSTRVFLIACIMQILAAAGILATGWITADRFAAYFVFFFAGYAALPTVMSFAAGLPARSQDAGRAFLAWLGVHTVFVAMGIAGMPVVSLILGFAGIFALVAAGVALSALPMASVIGGIGRTGLPVFLGFFIPMQVLQFGFTATGLTRDPGSAALAIAMVSLALSALAYRSLRGTPLRILYVRPRLLRLQRADSRRKGSLIGGLEKSQKADI